VNGVRTGIWSPTSGHQRPWCDRAHYRSDNPRPIMSLSAATFEQQCVGGCSGNSYDGTNGAAHLAGAESIRLVLQSARDGFRVVGIAGVDVSQLYREEHSAGAGYGQGEHRGVFHPDWLRSVDSAKRRFARCCRLEAGREDRGAHYQRGGPAFLAGVPVWLGPWN